VAIDLIDETVSYGALPEFVVRCGGGRSSICRNREGKEHVAAVILDRLRQDLAHRFAALAGKLL